MTTPALSDPAVSVSARIHRVGTPGEDEHMILNMGPSHPSTHGVLRILLELDGEQIVRAEPDIGYLHRGMEKIAEVYGYNKFVAYTDRFDYLAPIANNIATMTAVEKACGIEVTPRCRVVRVICAAGSVAAFCNRASESSLSA